jgi:hypothetical protein
VKNLEIDWIEVPGRQRVKSIVIHGLRAQILANGNLPGKRRYQDEHFGLRRFDAALVSGGLTPLLIKPNDLHFLLPSLQRNF